MGIGCIRANAGERIRIATPAQVEGCQLGEPELTGVRQVVVDPPGQWRPVFMLFIPGQQGWNHDAGSRAQMPVGIQVIPNMRGVAFLVSSAAILVAVLGPLGIDCWRTVSRTYDDATKALLQRLQQLLAETTPCFDGAVRIVRNIGDAFDLADFRVEEITYKKVFGKPDPPEILKSLYRYWLLHPVLLLSIAQLVSSGRALTTLRCIRS